MIFFLPLVQVQCKCNHLCLKKENNFWLLQVWLSCHQLLVLNLSCCFSILCSALLLSCAMEQGSQFCKHHFTKSKHCLLPAQQVRCLCHCGKANTPCWPIAIHLQPSIGKYFLGCPQKNSKEGVSQLRWLASVILILQNELNWGLVFNPPRESFKRPSCDPRTLTVPKDWKWEMNKRKEKILFTVENTWAGQHLAWH